MERHPVILQYETGPWLTLSNTDVRSAARVAVLGQTVITNLFGGENPIGKTIRINSSPFLVIGVLSPKGQSLDGRDQDDTVMVPVTTARMILLRSRIRMKLAGLMVSASPAL